MRARNPNYDPDNSLYDRESDEDFGSEDLEDDSSNEESSSSNNEESDYKPKRQNYHEEQKQRVESN
jgi:hypothetical protein